MSGNGVSVLIEVKDLVKRYGDHLALDHLNFTIEKGKVYGLLGANGAGKSTTMNIVTGYIGATSGTVLVDGQSVLDEPEATKRKIGYLPELPPLYMDMTVEEYLIFAMEIKKIPKERIAKHADEILDRVQLQAVRRRLIKNLSKGYKQRVGLAEALVGWPAIIILDEPTVGLDPQQIIEIRQLIRELAAEHTVILSSHILAEVQEVCDHILIIQNGKLIASETTEKLVAKMQHSQNLELLVEASAEQGEAVLKELKIAGPYTIKSVKPNLIAITIELAGKQEINRELFFAFAAKRLAILQMNRVTSSLEAVFLDLLRQEEVSEAAEKSAAKTKAKEAAKK